MKIEYIESSNRSYRIERMYSQIIGKKLLANIIRTFGYEILFQFGFTKSIISRMCTKGILGGEIDLLFSIRSLRKEMKTKYIKRWEFDLLTKVYNKFSESFNTKPVYLLSLFNKNSISKGFKFAETYEELMFGKKQERTALDRTVLFDALIFYICILEELRNKLDRQSMLNILNFNRSTDPKGTDKEKIFYSLFRDIHIDNRKRDEVIIAKNNFAYDAIPILYEEIRRAFNLQSIHNIKDYVKNSCGKFYLEYKNIKFVNFARHYEERINGVFIPNIFLGHLSRRSKDFAKFLK